MGCLVPHERLVYREMGQTVQTIGVKQGKRSVEWGGLEGGTGGDGLEENKVAKLISSLITLWCGGKSSLFGVTSGGSGGAILPSLGK